MMPPPAECWGRKPPMNAHLIGGSASAMKNITSFIFQMGEASEDKKPRRFKNYECFSGATAHWAVFCTFMAHNLHSFCRLMLFAFRFLCDHYYFSVEKWSIEVQSPLCKAPAQKISAFGNKEKHVLMLCNTQTKSLHRSAPGSPLHASPHPVNIRFICSHILDNNTYQPNKSEQKNTMMHSKIWKPPTCILLTNKPDKGSQFPASHRSKFSLSNWIMACKRLVLELDVIAHSIESCVSKGGRGASGDAIIFFFESLVCHAFSHVGALM